MATHQQVKDALSALPKKEMILATCAIIREQCWHLMKDERSKKAIEAAEGYVNGTVTREDLDKARSAAAIYAADYADYTDYADYAVATTAHAADYADYADYAVDAAAYATTYAAAAADADAPSDREKIRDRQLEIIAKFSKQKQDDNLVEILEKALKIAKKLCNQ